MPMWDAWRKLTNHFIYNRLRETQPLEQSAINRDPVARFHQGGGFRPARDCWLLELRSHSVKQEAASQAAEKPTNPRINAAPQASNRKNKHRGSPSTTITLSNDHSPLYASRYFPASIVFCAICWRNAIVLNGSCLDNLLKIANCVRSMSPSATSAITFLAAA